MEYFTTASLNGKKEAGMERQSVSDLTATQPGFHT